MRFSNHLNGSSDPVAMRALGTETSRMPGMWAVDPRTWLVVLLALLAVYRFSLIDRGHFAWGDELRCLAAGRLVDALSRRCRPPLWCRPPLFPLPGLPSLSFPSWRTCSNVPSGR